MEPDFWHERWRSGEIGFHQPDYHPALLRHWPGLGVRAGGRVLVPLCGRSLDMAWLARRNLAVVGVELSPIAVAGFFGHEGLEAAVQPAGALRRYAAGPYELFEGDFFDTSQEILGGLDAWYDRAALVALPPGMRARYAGHLASLVPSGATGLLVTLDYPQQQMNGPPFAVPATEVRDLLSAAFDVEELERQDVLAGNPRFRERGLELLLEMVFRLVRR